MNLLQCLVAMIYLSVMVIVQLVTLGQARECWCRWIWDGCCFGWAMFVEEWGWRWVWLWKWEFPRYWSNIDGNPFRPDRGMLKCGCCGILSSVVIGVVHFSFSPIMMWVDWMSILQWTRTRLHSIGLPNSRLRIADRQSRDGSWRWRGSGRDRRQLWHLRVAIWNI